MYLFRKKVSINISPQWQYGVLSHLITTHGLLIDIDIKSLEFL